MKPLDARAYVFSFDTFNRFKRKILKNFFH